MNALPDDQFVRRLGRLETGLQLLGEPQPLLSDARRVAQQAERLDDDLRLRAQAALVQAALRAGAYRDAQRALLATIRLGADSVDTRITIARCMSMSGDATGAVAYLRESLNAAETATAAVRYAMTLSVALCDIGELAEAKTVLERARAGTDASESARWLRIRLSACEARLADAAGMHMLALIHVRGAIAEMAATDDAISEGRLHLNAAEYAFFAPDLNACARHLQRGVILLREAGAAERMLLELLLGFLAVERGRGEDGEASARSLLARIGDDEPAEQGRTRWLLGRALVVQGRPVEAVAEFARADALLARAMRYTARLRRDWAAVLDELGDHQAAASLRRRADAVDRVRRLPRRWEILLHELEARQVAQRDAQAGQREVLGLLESRIAAVEHALGVRPQPARASRRPLW